MSKQRIEYGVTSNSEGSDKGKEIGQNVENVGKKVVDNLEIRSSKIYVGI